MIGFVYYLFHPDSPIIRPWLIVVFFQTGLIGAPCVDLFVLLFMRRAPRDDHLLPLF